MSSAPRRIVRVAGGLLLVALFGCESVGPVTAPERAPDGGPGMVADAVSQVAKEAAVASGRRGGGVAIGPMSTEYAVEPIPFAPEAGTPANEGPFCDDCVQNDVPIGFPFTFYGNTYTTLQISSNGFIRFAPANNDSGCCSGRPIPLDDLWNNIIAFAWTDLNPGPAGAGRMHWETRGSEPNRRWVLLSEGVTIWPNQDPRLTQWVVLHEGTNTIEIHTEFLTPHTQDVTQGIENATGTVAHFLPGRVATIFSLTNDGVRFTPAVVNEVDLHDVYSGDPRQDPGVIHLDDEWVYVEVLDVEQYLPRPASADDVRIGPNWADGTPAESFQILDINGDQNRDIRLRWSLQQLRDDGHLTPNTTSIQVWGFDQQTEEFYRGEHEVEVIEDVVVLFDNCGFVTHPGAGPGGADVSMASPGALNIAGLNKRHFPPDPYFRVADDFEVTGGPWMVTRFVTHGYQTGAAVPTWTGFDLNVWDGRPGDPGSMIIATTSTASISFSGVYRTFNGVLISTDRPVYEVAWEIPTLELDDGTYWIDWQVQGGASGWANMCMEPNPANPNAPITVQGNARQLTPDGWIDTLSDVPAPPAEFPFRVVGEETGQGQPAYRPADRGVPLTRPSPQRGPDARTADRAQ